jgi:hypothetical protein
MDKYSHSLNFHSFFIRLLFFDRSHNMIPTRLLEGNMTPIEFDATFLFVLRYYNFVLTRYDFVSKVKTR